jgi:transposase
MPGRKQDVDRGTARYCCPFNVSADTSCRSVGHDPSRSSGSTGFADRVLRVERVNDVLEIHLETADPARFCLSCGMAGVVKDRPEVRYADLPFGGQQAVLVWHKYRWECPGENKTWTEERPDIAARSMSALTHRAAVWATIQVGRLVRPVSQIAAEIGVSWNTVMNAVSNYGRALIDDPLCVSLG